MFTAGPGPLANGRPPAHIAVGDFNADGFPDAAVTNSGANNVTILLGSAAGTFTEPAGSPIAVGAGPSAIVAADFNRDGLLDLAVASTTANTVIRLKGDGVGGFTTVDNPVAVPSPGAMAVADFNRDSSPDLAVLSGNSVVILTSGLTQATGSPFSAGTAPTGLAVGDFNRDGLVDILVTNTSSDKLTLLAATSTGSFTASTALSNIATPSLPVAGDLNNDGKLDLALASGSGVILLRDVGTANFVTTYLGTGPASPLTVEDLALADMNGDGYLDIVEATSPDGAIRVLLGSGGFALNEQGYFAAGTGLRALAVADWNGDGKPDVMFGNAASGSNFVGVALNSLPAIQVRPASFEIRASPAYGATPLSLAVDTGSGPLASIAITAPAWLRPSSTAINSGTSTLSITYDTAAANVIDVLRLNAPGYYGAAIPVRLSSTKPAGTFVPPSGAPLFTAGEAVLADWNKDGKPDLLTLTTAGSATVIQTRTGNGDGTFGSGSQLLSVTGTALGLFSGDFNRDGRTDFALVEPATNSLRTVLGNGTGGILADASLNLGTGASTHVTSAVAAADLNNDGIPDLVSLSATDSTVRILLGTGTGSFALLSPLPVCSGPTEVRAADFNRDAKPDLAILCPGSDSISVLLNRGAGVFAAAPGSPLTLTGPQAIVAADFDGDAHPDLAVALASGGVTLLRSAADGQFSTVPGSPFATSITFSRFAPGDFDGDGTLDIVTLAAGKLQILIGSRVTTQGTATTGQPTFNPPVEFAASAGSSFLTSGDINGDFKEDVLTNLGAFLAVSVTPKVTLTQVDGSTSAISVGYGKVLQWKAAITADTTFLPPNVFAAIAYSSMQFDLSGSAFSFSSLQNGTYQRSKTPAVGSYSLNGRLFPFPLTSSGQTDFQVNAATALPLTVNVVKGPQTLTFGPLSSVPLGTAPFSVSVTADSGLAVILSSATPGVCTLAASTVTLVSPGTCTLTASQAGDSNYLPATVQQSIQVTGTGSQTQSITFAQPPDLFLDSAPLTLTPAATSALPVSLLTATPAVCMMAGGVLRTLAPGRCTITASQAGNATFAPAPPVSRTISVKTRPSGTLKYRHLPAMPVAMLGGPMVAADVNNDGFTDLVMLDGKLWVLLGDGAGNFTPKGTGPMDLQRYGSLAAGDFNNDGKADIVIFTPGIGTLTLLVGDGAGNFAIQPDLPLLRSSFVAGSSPQSQLAAGDLNGDGNQDIVLAAEAGTLVLLGNGAGAFRFAPGSPQLQAPGAFLFAAEAVLADTNGDGLQDLGLVQAVVGASTSAQTLSYSGDGTGRIPSSVLTSYPLPLTFSPTLRAADFNNDQVSDLLVGARRTGDGQLSATLYLSDGNGGITTTNMVLAETATAEGIPLRLIPGDFDGDGNADFLMPGDIHQLYRGNGTGTFSAGRNWGGAAGKYGYQVAGDFNGDGRLDLVDLNAALGLPGGTSPTTELSVFLGTAANTTVSLSSATMFPAAWNTAFTVTAALANPADANAFAAPTGSVTFSMDGGAAVTATLVNGTALFTVPAGTGGGPHSLIANYAGDSRNAPSVSPAFSFSIEAAPQTITFGPLSSVTLAAGNILLSATATSGLPIAYTSSTPAVCTVVASSVTLIGAGTCSIQAAQPGNAAWQAATPVVQSFSVGKGTQTLQFVQPSDVVLGVAPFALNATASSQLTVAFTSSTTPVCTVSGVTVTIVATGTCSLTASQPGNSAYDPAGDVTRSFAVLPRATVWNTSGFGQITRIGGNGTSEFTSDPGPATSSGMSPVAVVVDPLGNVFISDSAGNRIRRIDRFTGIITTIAGGNSLGSKGDGGPATAAQLGTIYGLALDSAGNLYLVDSYYDSLRKIDMSTGIITKLAGTSLTLHSGDGGPASAAGLSDPMAVVVDPAGNIYIAEQAGYIRKITAATGIITSIAGTGLFTSPGDGGPAAQVSLREPTGLALDAAGNLYVAESGNGRVRRIAAGTGIITTVAGPGTGILGNSGPDTGGGPSPQSLAFDSAGNLFIADTANCRIRRIDAVTGNVSTVAGNGSFGVSGDGGPATSAGIGVVRSIAADPSGNLLMTSGAYVRFVLLEPLPKAAQTITFPKPADHTYPVSPLTLNATASSQLPVRYTSNTPVVCTVSGNVVTVLAPGVCSVSANQPGNDIYLLAPTVTREFSLTVSGPGWGISGGGQITTLAGTGLTVFNGDGFAAQGAGLAGPSGVAVAANGDVYFSDTNHHRIRKISAATGLISTVAGTGTAGFNGDNAVGTSAQLNTPLGLVLDAGGNLYIADAFNDRIRRLSPAGALTTIAGTGTTGFYGDNSSAAAAQLNTPWGLAMDGSGNLYIADTFNQRIRKISILGTITTIAGSGTQGFAGDGGAATQAGLNFPTGVAVDSKGNIYISDILNHRIRRVAAGVISTVAGGATSGFQGDGGPATAALLNLPDGPAVDADGNVYFSDAANSRVRRITVATGIINSVTGDGTYGFSGDGGPAVAARVNQTAGLTLDSGGNLYIADNANNRIRFVLGAAQMQSQTISFGALSDRAIDAAPFAVSASSSSGLPVTFASLTPSICKVTGFTVTNLARGTCAVGAYQVGNLTFLAAGPVVQAFTIIGKSQTITFPQYQSQFSNSNLPLTAVASSGLKVSYTVTVGQSCFLSADKESLSIGDPGTCTMTARQDGDSVYAPAPPVTQSFAVSYSRGTLQRGQLRTLAGNGKPGYTDGYQGSSQVNGPVGVALDAVTQYIYIADTANHRIRRLDGSNGLSTFAGNGTPGFSFDGYAAAEAQVNAPKGVAVNGPAHFVYISDSGNHRIRRVDTITGIITTVAGTGTAGFGGEGGNPLTAAISSPGAIAVAPSGDIFFADTGNARIRRIRISDNKILTVASLTPQDVSGGLSVDSEGNVFFGGDTQVRRIAASNGAITVVAGGPTSGFSGDGGQATAATFLGPLGVAVDPSGNLFIADSGNHRLRAVSAATGLIGTISGTGTPGFNGDGDAAVAMLNSPSGLATDPSGGVVISDSGNQRIRYLRQATPGKKAQNITFTPVPEQQLGGIVILSASASSGLPVTFALPDAFLASQAPYQLGVCTLAGNVLTLVGAGTCTVLGIQDGDSVYAPAYRLPLSFVVHGKPQNITFTGLADQYVGTVSKITAVATSGGPVTASSNCSLDREFDNRTFFLSNVTPTICVIVASQAGNSEWDPVTVKRTVQISALLSTAPSWGLTTPGQISTIAGIGAQYPINIGSQAMLSAIYSPVRVHSDSAGNVYFGDDNYFLRRVAGSTGLLSTVDFPYTGYTATPQGMASDSAGNVYVAWRTQVLKVAAANGAVTVFAGNSQGDTSGDGGLALNAGMVPTGVALDTAGNLYIADSYNNRIRKIAADTRIITTIAGTGVQGYTGDGGPATAARLNSPSDILADSAGSLYFADRGNHAIRRIAPDGTMSTVAGTGAAGFSGDGASAASAQLNSPNSLARDNAGNIFIADTANNRIRKIDAVTGGITTIVGTGVGGYAGDPGSLAATAQLRAPQGVAVDSAGNLYIADTGNLRVRFVLLPRSFQAQTISFAAVARQAPGAVVTLQATATSGLAVTLKSNSPNTCSISGTTLTFNATYSGNICLVTASQLGNSTWASAATVSQLIPIATQQQITFTQPPNVVWGPSPMVLTATANSGLTVTFSSGTPAVCSVSGAVVSLVSAGTCTITADQAGNDTYVAATPVTRSFTISKADQSITFANPPDIPLPTPLTLTATTTSGLAVTFTASPSNVCTVSGSTLTPITAGACTVTATQPGNGAYAAAAPISRTFNVTAPAGSVTLSVGTTAGLAGDTVEIPIQLTSVGTPALTSWQFDLSFDPAKLTFKSGRVGASATTAVKALSAAAQPNGDIRFQVTGQNQNVIPNGTVAYASFTLASPFTPAPVTPKACAASGSGNVALLTTCTPGAIKLPCDLNMDSTVNVVDVQFMINEVLGISPAADDLNHDGTVTVADVQKVINAILGFGCPL